MRNISLVIGFTLLTLFSFSKGGAGKYYIMGKAFLNGKLMPNTTIMVEFNGEETEVKTDLNGMYKIIINWYSACPSGISEAEERRENKKLNPKWINLTCNGATMKIENQWEKYANLFPKSEDEITRKLDLKFENKH